MARAGRTTRAPIILGAIGVTAALILGFWQLDRLAWKEGLIAKLETRMAAEPVALPAAPDPERDQLLRVRVTGWISSQELHVLYSIKRLGPGFRVIAPMYLSDGQVKTGRVIMVDLGFVPERLKRLTARKPEVRLHKRLPKDEVTGLLFWPDETDSFTPEPDEGRRIWFARDVAAMAERLETEPVLVVAEQHPDGEWPLPQPPGSGLTNRHLGYVFTWFGLAFVWTIMAAVWYRAEWRKARRGAQGAK